MSSFHRNQQSAADIVYYGLFNQGGTGYLNSVLQVLFMTKDFREALERCDPHPGSINPQLRDVFDELMKRTSYTNDITNKLGIHTVWKQRDAAEYFEKILTLTSSDASQIFDGESRKKITCSYCHKENNTDGRFWHLPLELVDSYSDVYSVVDGIDEYFRTSRLSGKKQMYCDNCETKTDASMTCVMKHHPDVLTLLLKRFDSDYRYMSYAKNNRVVVVPFSLQIPENQTYELYAWVEHTSDLGGEHYTATIKSQENEKWYYFNGASVMLLHNQPFQTGNTEKSQSVQLLFYKKKRTAYSNGLCQPANRDSVPDRKGCDKKRQDSGDSKEARQLEQDKMKMMKSEEEEGGKEAEAYASAEKRELLSVGTQLVKREYDQKRERGKQKHVVKTTQKGLIPKRSDPEHKHEKDVDDEEGGKQGKGYSGQNSTLHAFEQTLLPAADIVYYGLFNQGATCYLNSVLQVLFMTKDFREAVERCDPHNHGSINPQLRDVFDELLKRRSYTYKITNKLGIHTVWEQRDAAEYFEKILNLTSSDASQIFNGESTHKITCSYCHKENNTDGRFWHLPLELVDSYSDVYSVVDGIDEYFRTSRFSGENQMYCDNCETKSDATMTCVMKHHPDVLTLLLKRFDFDYRYMSYVKNNQDVVVPSSLQIPENQMYELYAWVDHTGDLRGGHYTATIKSQENEKWYNFNDTSVTLLLNQPFQTGNTEKSRSAHLLFYKKKKTAYSNGLCQPANRDGVPDRKGCDKKRQDSGDSKEARQLEQDKMKMMKSEEEEGGKEAEAYASAEKRELLSVGTQLVKREHDQKRERGKQKHVVKTTQKGLIPKRSDPEHKREKDKDDEEGGKQGKDYSGQNSTLHAFEQTLLPAADIVYYGLFNQGTTGYLNSVLQVLFMTKDFRDAVERCDPHNHGSINPQLRDVFDELLKRTSYANEITNKLGIHTVWEQRDAAEYFEKILTLTSSDASQIFDGESRKKITCSYCHKENNTDGRFWHLPLELVDSYSDVYSVVDGIDEYFRTSRLSGKKQMYCDNCETKTDASMTCVMKHHPDVLTLLLKRFDSDYRYMSYAKNNRVVVVPFSLQIPENQTYELYAWVEHTSDLGGEHYTATIKSQENEKWYYFNGASVMLLHNQPFQTGNTEKSQSVQLLFYKKKRTAYSNGLCQPANRDSVPDRKGCDKKRQDSGDSKEARQLEQDKMKMMKSEEEEGGKEAEAYASAEKRELLSVGTQLVKREYDQKRERGKQKHVVKTTQKGLIPKRSDPEHKHEKDVDDEEGGKQGKGYSGQNSTLHAFEQTLLPAADIVYYGLFNQGATCYLNSVLQVLFMTKDFRDAVERCDPHNHGSINPQLRDVFDELLKRTSYTYKITNKLGIHTVWEQRDAAEYFEKILNLTSSDASQIFNGESTHKITCSYCHKESNTDGRFWHLPLELVDSYSDVYSVVDGIDEYFRTSRFSGENQMYCDHCETKSDATMTCVMKHHPEVLTLLLKRFDFDYRYMSYVKINQDVVIPSSLQIPENQTYELYAWVDHFGDLRGGHYTATIKSQENEKWYNFNDTSVTLLDNQPFKPGSTEKSRSAHLLFYKKKKTAYSNGLCQPANRDGVPDRKGCDKKRQDSGDSKEARQLEQDKMKMMKSEEEEGGKEAEAYASAEKRELLSVGTQLVKREHDQKRERGKQKHVVKTTQKGFIPKRSDPKHKHEKDVDDEEGGKQGKGYAGQNSTLHAFEQTLLPAVDIVYYGLFNQGTTGYLNSVLQVLFMTKDFRDAVERCDPHNHGSINPQLRDVFDELLKRTSYANEITNKLGIHTVWEQRDAAEYFEKILTLTSSDASQIFDGESRKKITCSYCHKENNTDGRFWHLPLELVDSYSDVYSVVDGIDEYFRTSRLSGKKQMYCDNCETKTDASMTCVMKHHPDVLTLLLKRFDSDYRYMSYAKNNRVVVVPSSLQIPENQTYELYAWVEHTSDLGGEHYTATIKSQENEKWYNFNGASVMLLHNQPFQTGNTEKSQSVQLLFYKKKRTAYSNGLCQPANRDGVPDRKGCDKKRQDSGDSKEARQLEQDKMKMMKSEEEEGGKEAEAYASAEKRELLSVGTQFVKRMNDQKCEGGKNREKQNKGNAECSQIRQSGRRGQAENLGDSSAGYEEWNMKSQRGRNREKTTEDTSKNRESIKRESDQRLNARGTLTKGPSGINPNGSPSPEPQQRTAGNTQEESESDAAPQSSIAKKPRKILNCGFWPGCCSSPKEKYIPDQNPVSE